MIKVQFLSEIRRSRKTFYVMQFVEMVCSGSEDLKKHKFTVWSEMEFAIFWQAVRILMKTHK
jgi:hypothetical protein